MWLPRWLRKEAAVPSAPAPRIPSKMMTGFAPWEAVELLANQCPDCGYHKFFRGPSAGDSTNYACANPGCGSEFNICILGPNQIMGERISEPSPNKLKPREEETKMNERLKLFLEEINDDDVEEIYSWLDGNPLAINEMKKVIADAHPALDIVRP